MRPQYEEWHTETYFYLAIDRKWVSTPIPYKFVCRGWQSNTDN